MTTLKLTDGVVEGIPLGERDSYVWDTALPRFGLRVTPAGTRIYLVQFRAKASGGGSRTRRIVIGRHDGDLWSVTKARAAARKLLAPVDLGKDPFADREDDRAARADAAEAKAAAAAAAAHNADARARDAFEKVAERFIDLCLKDSRSGHEVARLIRQGPAKAWTGRHIAEIRRADVADLIDAIRKRSPATARLTYAALRGLFGWCVERDLIAASPCDRLKAPPRPEARDRVLSDDELRAIWRACEGLGHPFGPIIRLLMLTGQRRAEVAGMAWSEIDIQASTWRIPRERTKNGRAHEVDLSAEALAIINAVSRTGDVLFEARRAPARVGAAAGSKVATPGAARGFSATKRRLDELAKLEKMNASWRLHDLRRTAATGMAGMGIAPHVIERILNHVSGVQGGLVGVYQRHEYRVERKAALADWGQRVAAIASGEALPSDMIAPAACGGARAR